MPVYKDRRGRLFIEFQYKGERIKERLPEGTKEGKAKAIEIRLRNAILTRHHGLDGTAANEITFERFLAEFYGPHIEPRYSKVSFENAVKVCSIALPFFKGKTMRSIRPADIERFQDSRRSKLTIHGRPRKPATVARELAYISKIFSLAVKNGFCDYNPCGRIDREPFDNIQHRILRREDEEAFFANMHSEWARDVCRFALNTGLRQNDIMNLTRFQVDRDARLIRLVQRKTTRVVEVPLNSTAMRIIENRWNAKGGLLFASPKSGTSGGSVRHAMMRACDRAKIPRVTIRDLRRTFATRGLEAENDAAVIADALGHSSMRMVLRYARSMDSKRKLVDSLENPATIPPSIKLKKVK